ncbi:histidine kinase dimerization/phospho-acceptor domain-containing protein [Paraburkholderia sp. BR13444]|uniref:histidine kinase dimerization/phospho-acceptor domain-containing protein n=1 Tax=Paraburkholderia sp. BR13444 TaxID=3236997 RepID=UPI0034CF524E
MDLFAGVLAHDLRSPLGAILNSAEALLHDEDFSSRSVRAVAFVQRGAMRMKQMIDDLLVFTRTRLGDAMPVSFTRQDIWALRSSSGSVETPLWQIDAARFWRASAFLPDPASPKGGRGPFHLGRLLPNAYRINRYLSLDRWHIYFPCGNSTPHKSLRVADGRGRELTHLSSQR